MYFRLFLDLRMQNLSVMALCTAIHLLILRNCLNRLINSNSVRTLFFAGQMTGVEGYVESAASGLIAGMNAAEACTRAGAACIARRNDTWQYGKLYYNSGFQAFPADECKFWLVPAA